MPEKYVAILNIGKALAAIPLAALAAWGGATGNPVLATLLAVPAVALSSSDTVGSQLAKLKSHKNDWEQFRLAAPDWWPSDSHLWENICREIIDQLPTILQDMTECMHREQRVKTMEVITQIFTEALMAQHSIWVVDTNERRKIAEFVAKPILQKLNDILGPVLEQIQKEEALIDGHNTALNTEKIATSVEKTTDILQEWREATKPHTLNDSELLCLHQEYCNKLYENWKMLDFKGIQHSDMNRPISIPLLDVFVFPDVLAGVPDNETLERDDELKESDRQKRKENAHYNRDRKELFIKKGYSRAVKQSSIQREDLQTILSKHRRLVILGDPGSGKSTLLRYILLILGERGHHFNTNFPQLASEVSDVSPLYIPLATFAEVWSTNTVGERSLKDFLPKYLRDNYLDCYIECILVQLQQGKLFILLDGLDEIPDASLRIQIIRQIEIFTHSYPKNRFVVTSRIVGYKDASLMAEYTPYTLADFSEEQIKEFTRKWCPAYEKWVNQVENSQSLQDVATKEAEKLFDATRLNEGVRRLAVNPLLLTILALIQRQGIELPSHRVELFDLCATTLLDTWLKAKGITGKPRFSKNDLIKILRPLAFWMHEQQSVGAIPEEELLEQIVKQLLERKITRDEVEARSLAEEEFLQTVRGKTGILIERGRHRYGFLHLTFEEFFAAWELVLLKKDRDHFIKEHLHDPRWRVVILLAVSIIGILQNDEDGVTEIVQEAILKADSPFNKWLHRDLLLAGICLADDIGVSVECKENIIEQIVYLYITSPHNSIRARILVVLEAWKNTHTATEAAMLVVNAMQKQNILFNGKSATGAKLPANTTNLECQLHRHYQRLLQQNQEACIQLMQLGVITILHHSGIDVSDRVEYMLSALSNTSSNVRQTAAIGLGEVSGKRPEVIEALLKAFPDTNRNVRRAIVTALAQVGSKHPEVVDALLTALSDTNWNVRRAAVAALAQIGSEHPEVVDALIKALSDNDKDVREAIATALGQIGGGHPEVADALLKALSDSHKDVRQAATTALGQISDGHPERVETLLKSLSDSSWNIRRAAATALGQISGGHPEVVDALLKALSDNDEDVREAVATALGQIGGGHPEVVDALLKALSDNDKDVREAVATALGQIGGGHPEVVDALLKALSDNDKDVREAVATALGQIGGGHPEVVDALLKALSDNDEDIRKAAASGLGQVGSEHPEVVDALLKALLDTNRNVRRAAVKALVLVGGEQSEAVDVFLKALSDSDKDIREIAARRLGQIGRKQPKVVDALLKAFSDANTKGREAAIKGLEQVGNEHPEVVEALLKALADPYWEVRGAAARGLQQADSGHPEVVDALFKALSDPNWGVREAAAKKLGQIGSDTQLEVIDILLKTLSDSDEDVRKAATKALEQISHRHPQAAKYLSANFSEKLSNNPLEWQNKDKPQEVIHTILPRMITLLGQAGNWSSEVVDVLLKALSDPDWRVREATVTAMGRTNSKHPEVIQALLKALSDNDEDVRRAAATALGQIGSKQPEVVDALLKALSDPNWDIREAAAEALGQVGNRQPKVVNALLKVLSDPDWDVRETAAKILGRAASEQPGVVDALLKALPTSDRLVRWTVTTALAQIGNTQSKVVDALLKALFDPDWRVREATITAMGRTNSKHPEVMQALLKALSDNDEDVRRAAATALGQIGSKQPEVVDALLKALPDSDKAMRQTIVTALGQTGSKHPKVIQALLKAFPDSDKAMRQTIVTALGQTGSKHPEVVDTLLKALPNSDKAMRQTIVAALGQIDSGHPQVVDALLKALFDSYDGVRQVAAIVLGQIDSEHPQVVDTLLKALSDPNWRVRQEIAKTLGQIGSKHPGTVDALFKTLTDSNWGIRQTAVTALGQIGDEHPEVVDALLKTLLDLRSDVQREAAIILSGLTTNGLAIGELIERRLAEYELLAAKQVTVDSEIDTLLFALQQVVGDV